ncbi:hypothetical protein SME46J_48370 (plasmid) [Serratia marcescens]|nr:hypothetical protein SME46J_48370 [Serratia marcescens]
MTKVTLGQLRLRLHSQERQADGLQARCSTWFQVRLQQELAALLTEYAGEDDVPRTINRLSLNVGDIPLSRFESVMSERVIKQLKQQLLAQSVAPGRDVAPSIAFEGAVVETSSFTEAPSFVMTQEEASLPLAPAFEQLLRYLDTGVVTDMRRWSRRDTRDAWLREVLDGAPSAPAPGDVVPPRIALAWRLLQPRAWQRLVMTWPGRPLIRLAAWLITPQRLPAPTPHEAARMLPLAALIALQHHPAAAAWTLPAETSTDMWPLADGVDAQEARPPIATELLSEAREGEPPPLPSSSRLDTWLNTLLSAPLPVSWRGFLQTCLGEAANIAHRPSASEPAGTRALSSPGETGRLTTPASLAVSSPLPVQGEVAAPWWVANAGLVLLWPLLPRLFSQFGWLDEGHFSDDEARWQAVGCLDWLAWGDNELAEWRTPCARLLCGIAEEVPFEARPLAPALQAELDTWLGQVFACVPHLGRCSASDLRIFFLQRAGILTLGDSVLLTIAPEATDVLLHNLPWPLTHVILPWRATFINVDWNT